tara:strand:- start:228 stop:482 length:255 start_codon:yes stop_codon:yes gene_type:complete
MLVATVKVETWVCSYIDNGKPASTNFVREGKIFREDDHFIQLWFHGGAAALPSSIVLFKKYTRFTEILPLPNGNAEINGSCKVY